MPEVRGFIGSLAVRDGTKGLQSRDELQARMLSEWWECEGLSSTLTTESSRFAASRAATSVRTWWRWARRMLGPSIWKALVKAAYLRTRSPTRPLGELTSD